MRSPAPTAAPAMPPTYRIDRSFEWNAEHGPALGGSWPTVPETPLKSFFGLPVRSRFGVGAGLLLNATWLKAYSRLGFDILTYKTVRLVARQAHPWPNWLFLQGGRAPSLSVTEAAQTVGSSLPGDPAAATAAGSIGTPSTAPAFWEADIRRARACLRPGQVLIVSILATEAPGKSPEAFVAEFEELAARVREAGADIVEANLSCPNVVRGEGEAYRDAPLAGRIAAAVRRGAAGLPVLVKVGPPASEAEAAALLQAVAGAADGIVMINAPSRRIVDASGGPAFGPGRERAGIIGGDLHSLALGCVRRAIACIERDRLDLAVVGVGGVASASQARAFLDAGACAALSISAAAWHPALAADIKRSDPTL